MDPRIHDCEERILVPTRNQLTSVAADTYYTPPGSGWRTDFLYDGRGRLRRRTEYTWNPYYTQWGWSSERRYLYDGRLVIQERDQSNSPTVTYTRGLDLSGSLPDGPRSAGGIGGLLARSHGYVSGTGAWTYHNFYQADAGGNITAMADNGSPASLVASYRYDPYGRIISQSGSLASANVHRFSSKEYLTASGLYYYGFRFYDPLTQRWLNRDPLGESGGSNLYRFAENDPLDRTDPSGLDVKPPDQKTMGFCMADSDRAVVLAHQFGVKAPDGKTIWQMWTLMKDKKMPQTLTFTPTKNKADAVRTETKQGSSDPTIHFPKCDPTSRAKDIPGDDGMYYFPAAIIHELIHAYGRMTGKGDEALETHKGSFPKEAQAAGVLMNDRLDWYYNLQLLVPE
jgi:RHS repeat-associated protein